MRRGDTATFNSAVHETTVKEMSFRHESVHDRGEEVFRQTGQLDPMVNIFGKRRASRNAFEKNPDGTTCTLTCGIKLPVVTCTDGTGSMGGNVAKAFNSMQAIFDMLFALKHRYHLDLSEAVVQDVRDEHPVYQMAQFESDNKAAEHVRLLCPDRDGKDNTEDYDLGLLYLDQAVDTDIGQYGLKGYLFVIADSDGRGYVTPESAKKYLGLDIQGNKSTKSICQSLIQKWHFYFIQVEGSYSCNEWWTNNLGSSRLITIDDPDLLAEVQAGLIYVTETAQPNRDGLATFLFAGGANKKISEYDIDRIWGWLQTARIHFGAQAKLPGFDSIPKPGDVFAHYRDPWPIGHPRAIENPSATGNTTPPITPAPSPDPIPWDKL